MIVIQYGMAKSGSSFVFQLLTNLMQNRFQNWSDYINSRNHLVEEKYHGDYIEILNTEVDDLIASIPDNEFFLFKTHDAIGVRLNDTEYEKIPPKVFQWLNEKTIKVIATVRDPRDMCMSYLDHAEANRRGEKDFFNNKIYSVFDAVTNVKNEYRILKYWTIYNGIHWVSYPQICEQPLKLLEAISNYVGLHHIESPSHLNELLNNKEKIHQYNKGVMNRWITDLSAEDAEKLTFVLKEEINQYHEICKKAEDCINLDNT